MVLTVSGNSFYLYSKIKEMGHFIGLVHDCNNKLSTEAEYLAMLYASKKYTSIILL